MEKSQLTVKKLIQQLLDMPMDATVSVGVLNRNQVTQLKIDSGNELVNSDEIWVNDDLYGSVRIIGLVKTEGF